VAGGTPTELTATTADADGPGGASAPPFDDDEVAAVLAPVAEGGDAQDDDDGGPPYVLIAGALAALALLGGLGLAVFGLYDRDPPLVDIRQWDQA
jgi:hypothetical protein